MSYFLWSSKVICSNLMIPLLLVSEQVFIPAVSHMKIANIQFRNYTPKRENCFAILISVCNFHISLQFLYQFAILTFWCIVPTWTFTIFIWVCNFHIILQFSYQFAILTSRLQHLLTLLCLDSVTMTLNSINSCQPWFSVEDKDKN